MARKPQSDPWPRARRKRIPGIVFWLTALCALPCSGLAQKLQPEAEVKAAFVYNFGKFVDWPAMDPGERSFAICVLGRADAFQKAVMTLAGKQVQGRTVAIRSVRRAEDAADCRIAVVGESEARRVDSILAALDRQPVLTVSDIEGFAAAGGMLGLVLADERVAFEVNTAAARRAGLRLSAQLIELGRRPGEPGSLGTRR
jgi:hypothetical protein